MTEHPIHLEYDSVEAGLVGRDPRKMSEAEFEQIGIVDRPLLDVIRSKCLDCVAGAESEVRRCVSVRCDLWPYRMRKNPLRRREMSDEQRAAAAERLGRARRVRTGDEAEATSAPDCETCGDIGWVGKVDGTDWLVCPDCENPEGKAQP